MYVTRSLIGRLMATGLRARIILLTILAMLPLLGLLVVEADASRRDIVAATRARANYLAKIGAAREDAVIQEVQDVFGVLGRLPEFTDPSSKTACSSVLTEVVHDHPQILFLATTAVAGHIVCASVAAAVGADVAQWEDFRSVLRPHGLLFNLSRPQPILGVPMQPSLAAMAPLPGQRSTASGVFLAELDLAWFSKLANRIAGDRENRAAIIDTDSSTLLATSSPAAGFSGEADPTYPALLAARHNPNGGVVNGAGPDKTACIYGYAPIQATDIVAPHADAILAVGIAWKGVTQEANRQLFIWLSLALLAMMAAVGAAAWLAEASVLRPVRLLTQVAQKLSEGELDTRADLNRVPVAELIVLGHALNFMAGALERLALTDALTGLANRRHFDQALNTELARAIRSGQPLALLMIDVDHFKAFNDRYGHAAGDGCLRHLATALQATPSRSADLVARYGGEEFVVMLPNTNSSGAVRLAGRILARIRDLALDHAGAPTRIVTVSIGIASSLVRGPSDGVRLLARADKALYAAKTGGRDRLCLAEADAHRGCQSWGCLNGDALGCRSHPRHPE